MDGFDGGMYNAVDAGVYGGVYGDVYGGLCQQLIDRVWARELMCVSPKQKILECDTCVIWSRECDTCVVWSRECCDLLGNISLSVSMCA